MVALGRINTKSLNNIEKSITPAEMLAKNSSGSPAGKYYSVVECSSSTKSYQILNTRYIYIQCYDSGAAFYNCLLEDLKRIHMEESLTD